MCQTLKRLFAVASTACAASGPELPSVASPLVNINGAVEVGGGVAGSLAGGARVPLK